MPVPFQSLQRPTQTRRPSSRSGPGGSGVREQPRHLASGSGVRLPRSCRLPPFGAIADARAHCQVFFPWFNDAHRHSGIAFMTPADVHYERVPAILEVRAQTLDAAFAANPQRFKGHPVDPQTAARQGLDQPAGRRLSRPSGASRATLNSTPRCLIFIDKSDRQRSRVRAMSGLGTAKSNRHRKTYPVEPGGTGRKYMFLFGEIGTARADQKSAEAVVALTPGESWDERRAEESREDHSLDRMWKARRSPT
jgi:hypothetical protein